MNGCIADTLPIMDRLLTHLEQTKLELSASASPLVPAVEAAWEKLDQYYRYTDQSSAYIVALILDPRVKLNYFHRQWSDNPMWITNAENRFEEMYERLAPKYASEEPEVWPSILSR